MSNHFTASCVSSNTTCVSRILWKWTEKGEHHYIAQFLVKLGDTSDKIAKKSWIVYKDMALKSSHIYEWECWFQEGRELVADDSQAVFPTNFQENPSTRLIKFPLLNFCSRPLQIYYYFISLMFDNSLFSLILLLQ